MCNQSKHCFLPPAVLHRKYFLIWHHWYYYVYVLLYLCIKVFIYYCSHVYVLMLSCVLYLCVCVCVSDAQINTRVVILCIANTFLLILHFLGSTA